MDCEERKINRNNKANRRQGREIERSYIGAGVPISIGLLFLLKSVELPTKELKILENSDGQVT